MQTETKSTIVHWQVRRKMHGRGEFLEFYGSHAGLNSVGSEDETKVTCRICQRAIRLMNEKLRRDARRAVEGASRGAN